MMKNLLSPFARTDRMLATPRRALPVMTISVTENDFLGYNCAHRVFNPQVLIREAQLITHRPGEAHARALALRGP
jgi:hypothetical protein